MLILFRGCGNSHTKRERPFFAILDKVNHSKIAPMVALPDYILMSAEEYLVWEPTQEERYEYWDGEVVMMSGATRNHNRISLNFSKLKVFNYEKIY